MKLKCRCGWYYETEWNSNVSRLTGLCHFCLEEVEDDRTRQDFIENHKWGETSVR